MNRFCKTFFTVFFTLVIALMMLLSYGLNVQLHRFHGDRGENLYQAGQIVADSVCQSSLDLIYCS